jgi:hypothetical protein
MEIRGFVFGCRLGLVVLVGQGVMDNGVGAGGGVGVGSGRDDIRRVAGSSGFLFVGCR